VSNILRDQAEAICRDVLAEAQAISVRFDAEFVGDEVLLCLAWQRGDSLRSCGRRFKWWSDGLGDQSGSRYRDDIAKEFARAITSALTEEWSDGFDPICLEVARIRISDAVAATGAH
jgi:hypothetical protein